MATPYLLPADLRSVSPLQDEDRYPDARLAQLIDVFEGVAEGYRGVAFTPRVATETVRSSLAGSVGRMSLLWPKVRSITSVTVDSVVVDAGDYVLSEDGGLYAVAFPAAVYGAEAVFVYQHGFDAPGGLTWPGASLLLEACRQYVRSKAVLDGSQVARDALSVAGPEGGTTQYSTPNAAEGRPTGYLVVDELLNMLPDYRIPGVG